MTQSPIEDLAARIEAAKNRNGIVTGAQGDSIEALAKLPSASHVFWSSYSFTPEVMALLPEGAELSGSAFLGMTEPAHPYGQQVFCFKLDGAVILTADDRDDYNTTFCSPLKDAEARAKVAALMTRIIARIDDNWRVEQRRREAEAAKRKAEAAKRKAEAEAAAEAAVPKKL